MSGGHEPEDVLDAVRALESQLAHLRSRVHEQRAPEPEGTQVERQLREMRDEAMRERRAVVDDLRMIVDLVAAGAERSSREINALRTEVRELRELADSTLAGARFELRMQANGSPSVRSGGPTMYRPPRSK